MRKSLEVVVLGMLGVLYWMTWAALRGPNPLPGRIPTHFDVSGNPNGWGPSNTLLLLPIVATGVYLLITVLAGISTSFNYPVRVTAENLPFIQVQTRNMVSWIKLEMICLFAYVQMAIIEAARSREFHLSGLMIPIFMLVVFGTVGWYVSVIVRGAKAHENSPTVG
jgi:uncharacterized membrane protein